MDVTAMALTDHGAMYGVIPFYAAARQAGIKPIIGLEAYLSPRGMPQKEGKLDADRRRACSAICSRCRISTTWRLRQAGSSIGYCARRHSAGLIGTPACLGGEGLKRLGRSRGLRAPSTPTGFQWRPRQARIDRPDPRRARRGERWCRRMSSTVVDLIAPRQGAATEVVSAAQLGDRLPPLAFVGASICTHDLRCTLM